MKKQKVKKFGVGIVDNCEHDFVYSHIEYPPMGIYSAMPSNKEVVVCRKCGKIIKTIAI